MLTCWKLHWEWTKDNIFSWIYLFDRFAQFREFKEFKESFWKICIWFSQRQYLLLYPCFTYSLIITITAVSAVSTMQVMLKCDYIFTFRPNNYLICAHNTIIEKPMLTNFLCIFFEFFLYIENWIRGENEAGRLYKFG